jgi:hypothetical protein
MRSEWDFNHRKLMFDGIKNQTKWWFNQGFLGWPGVGFLTWLGTPSHHGCFKTKSWSNDLDGLGYPHFWKPPYGCFMDFIWGLYNMSFMFLFKWVLLIGFMIMRFLWGLYGRKNIGLNIIGCIIVIMIIIVYECLRYVLSFFLVKVMQLIWSYSSIHGNIHGF